MTQETDQTVSTGSVWLDGYDSSGKPSRVRLAVTDESLATKLYAEGAVTEYAFHDGSTETLEQAITSSTDWDTDIPTSLLTLTPSGPFEWLNISFMDVGSASSVIVYVVFSADDAADAAAKLALAGARLPVPIGASFEIRFPSDALCDRIDLYTPNLETGTGVVVFHGRVG